MLASGLIPLYTINEVSRITLAGEAQQAGPKFQGPVDYKHVS
jgi:hypothetical protein